MTTSTTYGCHNRPPLAEAVVVQSGWTGPVTDQPHTRRPLMVAIPNPMTRDCNYTTTRLGAADVRCLGCKHKTPSP